MTLRLTLTVLWLAVFCGLGLAGKVTITVNNERRGLPWFVGVWAGPIMAAAIGAFFYAFGWLMTWPLLAWLQ